MARTLVTDDLNSPKTARLWSAFDQQIVRVIFTVIPGIVAALGILGWAMDVDFFKRLNPTWASMKPMTALCILALSVALLVGKKSGKILHLVLSGLVLSIGLLTLFEYATDITLAIDYLLFPGSTLREGSRMSVATALCLSLLAWALLSPRILTKFLAFCAWVVGLIGCLGYLYNAHQLSDFNLFSTMALHTAISILMISTVLLVFEDDGSLSPFFGSAHSGSRIARQLMPMIVILASSLGWIRLQGQRAGFFGTETGLAIMVTTFIVTAMLLLWRSLSLLNAFEKKSQAEAKAKNDELMAKDSRLSAIYENSPVPMVLMSWPDGRIRDVNPVWIRLFEFDKSEVFGKTTFEIGMIRDQEKRADTIVSISEFGFIKDLEMEAFSKSGKAYSVLVDGRMFELSGQKYLIYTLIDVTERIRLEKQLTVSEKKFFATYEHSPLPMALMTWPAGLISDVNPAWLRLFEFRKEEVLGKTTMDIGLYRESTARSAAHKLLSENKSIVDLDTEAYSKSGKALYVKVYGNRFVLGEQQFALISHLDVTQRRMAEEALAVEKIREQSARETSRLKSEFLANMSHEIRTPINGVMGMANLLLETSLDEEQREYASYIVRSGDTLLALVNDILDLSKAEAGKIEIENIEFELTQVIEDVEKTLSYQARNKGLYLLRAMAPNLPRFLKGDPTRLRQILMNLVSNAIKFTPSGHVKISVGTQSYSPGRYELRFEVEDTGIGIPEEALSRMFRAFSQADASTTRRFGGTGLGLSISKHLTKLMGGEIGVDSVDGKGSAFWFTVNLTEAAEGKQTARDVFELQQDAPRLRILLAEDNPVNQFIAVKLLERMGHSVAKAVDGNEAIDALRLAPYDLILMDCQMPGMDGYEATQIIRSSNTLNCQGIKIIAMTANAMDGDRERCLAIGMDDYISKPFNPSELQAVLERVFKRSSAA